MSSPSSVDPTKNPFADDDDIVDAPTKGANPHTLADADSTLEQQQRQWDVQDSHLDTLSASLNRQHEMSLQMDQELDLHHDLLREFDRDVDRTGLHLGGAASRLNQLRSSIKDHGKTQRM